MRTARNRKLWEKAIWSVFLATALLTAGVVGNVAAAPDVTDASIQDAVEDELMFDQAVSAHSVDVLCVDGIVTLTGTTGNLLAKERAGDIAGTVKGVRAVINRIEATPVRDKSDKTLRDDVKQALLLDPATESYEINVIAEDDIVTLTGTVESWQEMDLAEKVAKGVSGVKAVENDITVSYEPTRTDNDIRADIQQALKWDALVDHVLIDVRVDNGHVALVGTVGSAAEKTQAERDAWVAGVKKIDSDGLRVARWARDDDLRKDKYVVKTDKAVKKAVEKALLYDPRVVSTDVEADVSGGVVTLRGDVNHLRARQAAAQDARNTVGVFRVKNRLKISPPELLSDGELEEKLRDALARDVYVESYEITADVTAGVANLYGAVDSYFEKTRAEDVASRVSGILAVDNNLSVSETWAPYVYDPYVDPYYVYDYDWYAYEPGQTLKTDWEIRQDINDELFWSPFVDADQVNVVVDDAVATLTGTVDSWSEYHAAAENALEGGASIVDNDLNVKPWMD